MKEIEFKCWNVEEKIMHDIAFPSWNGSVEVWANNIPQSEIQYLSINGPVEHGVLLQFTNILDKRKNKIFDKDILIEDQSKNIGVVEFKNGTWKIRFIKPYRQRSSRVASIVGLGSIAKFFSRIGNLYENPKLITVDN